MVNKFISKTLIPGGSTKKQPGKPSNIKQSTSANSEAAATNAPHEGGEKAHEGDEKKNEEGTKHEEAPKDTDP